MRDITLVWTFVVIALSIVSGFLAGYYARKVIAESRIGAAEEEAARIIDEAGKEAEAKKKEILLEAKEEIHRNRQEAEKDLRERRRELDRIERRVLQKEELKKLQVHILQILLLLRNIMKLFLPMVQLNLKPILF